MNDNCADVKGETDQISGHKRPIFEFPVHSKILTSRMRIEWSNYLT